MEEISKIEIIGTIKEETTETGTTSEKMEEIISEEIIETLTKMGIINLGIIEITKDSKTEIEITKVEEEVSEIDKIIVIFLIEAELIKTEVTLEEITEIFQTKRKHNRKFLHLQ